MKVTLESTALVTMLRTPDGSVPVRRWEGTTEGGIPIHVYIARVCPNALDDAAQLEREQADPREASPLIVDTFEGSV